MSDRTGFRRKRLRTLRRLLGARVYPEARAEIAAKLEEFVRLADTDVFTAYDRCPPHRVMSAGKYLAICRLCYLAQSYRVPPVIRRPGIPQRRSLRSRSSSDLYRAFADGRTGGLLDLPRRSERAFRAWLSSREWHGCHPWEFARGRCRLVVEESPQAGYVLTLSPFDPPSLATIEYSLALHQAGISFCMLAQDLAQAVCWARGDTWVTILPDNLFEPVNEERAETVLAAIDDWVVESSLQSGPLDRREE